MSNVKRRLATILATDCVDFSKHMIQNEELTLENLKACRSIIDPLIKEYGFPMMMIGSLGVEIMNKLNSMM